MTLILCKLKNCPRKVKASLGISAVGESWMEWVFSFLFLDNYCCNSFLNYKCTHDCNWKCNHDEFWLLGRVPQRVCGNNRHPPFRYDSRQHAKQVSSTLTHCEEYFEISRNSWILRRNHPRRNISRFRICRESRIEKQECRIHWQRHTTRVYFWNFHFICKHANKKTSKNMNFVFCKLSKTSSIFDRTYTILLDLFSAPTSLFWTAFSVVICVWVARCVIF